MRTIYLVIFLCIQTASVVGQEIADLAELIVTVSKADAHKTNLADAIGLSGLPYHDITPLTKDGLTYLVSFDDAIIDSEVIAKAIRKSGKVHAVQPNHLLSLRSNPPNDNLIDEQWYLDMVHADHAWNLSKGGVSVTGDSIVIAVIDNGFDLSHEDLYPNIWVNRQEIPNDGIDNDGNGYIDDSQGWNFNSENSAFTKKNHGTSVLGLIGAKGNNNKGIAGINWKIKLLPISIDNKLSTLLKAFDYVKEMRRLYNESNGAKGAYIVAATYSGGKSFEFAKDNPIWCDRYNDLGEVGVLSMGATANINMDVDVHGDMPSTCPSDYLVVVTSTDDIDSKLISAGYGSQSVDLGAPGIDLLTTHIDDIYHSFSGTSAATPLVAGTVGLLYSIPNQNIATKSKSDPAGTAKLIKNYILSGTKSISSLENRTVSGGRLDLANMVRFLSQDKGGSRQGVHLEKVYPNPISDVVNITLNIADLDIIQWTITDASGRVIISESQTPSDFPTIKKTFDLTALPIGQYFLSVAQGNFVKSKKIQVLR